MKKEKKVLAKTKKTGKSKKPKKPKAKEDNILLEKSVYPESHLAEDGISFFPIEEETKKNSPEKKQPQKKLGVMKISFAFLITVAILNSLSSFLDKREGEKIEKEEIKISTGPLTDEEIAGVVRGEEDDVKAQISLGSVQVSENFEAKQVSVGGDILALAEEELAPLELFDIRSESFIPPKEENGKVRLVVSWRTNKMAIGDIEYSKSNGQDTKTTKESAFNFDHNIVVNDLEPKTSYVFKVKCRDKWGNEKESGHFGVYTVSEKVSVFDMISEAMNKIFGWAFD